MMMPPIGKTVLMPIAIALTVIVASGENDKQIKKQPAYAEKAAILRDLSLRERSYQGKPLAYWLNVLADRDEEAMLPALDAVRFLGPDARTAVALTRVVTAPFDPIRIGQDSDDLMASKLIDIELRSEAIDILASMGETASSATGPLIDWAVTMRVIPPDIRNSADDERFIDLVTMDAEKRIQVVIAIAEFGDAALPAIAAVLKSPDAAKRKLAVAILGEDALTIAGDLLRSRDCDDARLGIAILGDMEPVVAKPHLTELRNRLVCYAN